MLNMQNYANVGKVSKWHFGEINKSHKAKDVKVENINILSFTENIDLELPQKI